MPPSTYLSSSFELPSKLTLMSAVTKNKNKNNGLTQKMKHFV